MRKDTAEILIWLLVYWAVGVAGAVVAVLYVVLTAILGPTRDPQQLFGDLGLAVGAAGTLVGAILATRLAARGPTTAAFLKGTAYIRVTAVGWLIYFVLALVTSAITSGNTGLGFGEQAGGLLETVSLAGIVGFLAVLGPGMADYRTALDAFPRAEPASPTP